MYMRDARRKTRRKYGGWRPCEVKRCRRQANRAIAGLALCNCCARNLERHLGPNAIGLLDGTEAIPRAELLRMAASRQP